MLQEKIKFGEYKNNLMLWLFTFAAFEVKKLGGSLKPLLNSKVLNFRICLTFLSCLYTKSVCFCCFFLGGGSKLKISSAISMFSAEIDVQILNTCAKRYPQ